MRARLLRVKKLLLVFALTTTTAALAETVHFKNGLWFDGTRFQPGAFYSVNGVLSRKAPAHVDRSVDLGGKYVVPPYGDAHHHGIDSAAGLDAKLAAFRDAGVFYVKNPNVIPDLLTAEVRAKINKPAAIDVAFSNGGLTKSHGHPVKLHAYLSKNGVFPGLKPEDMNDRAYFTIDNLADLVAKWPRIAAGKPDFIKTFVLFTGTPKQEGLDPVVLREIVKRAHANGLRVSSHIETAADFRAAVDAGVDEINHLPTPRKGDDFALFTIDEGTARRAAKRKITVVTTQRPVHMAGMAPPSDEQIALAKRNVATLRRAGVSVALGSDGISGEQPFATARDEALWLARHGFADNLSLLKMWSETTPRTIFPRRRIGALRPGYEASFLVLDGDPVADFANATRISMRVKQGQLF